jgi:hypothetical protein
VPTDALTAILATIRQVESGGNYQAHNPGSTASGAYQFIDSTWRGVGGTAYAPRAYLATPAEQDAVARAYVEKIMAAHPGDLDAIPQTWYTGRVGGDLDRVPAGNKLSVRQYVAKWRTELGRHVDSSVVDVAKAAVAQAKDAATNLVTDALGELAEPFLKGLGRIAIIGIAVTAGMALVVAGGWRGVKSGG